MRRLIVTTGLVATLAFATSALAVLPSQRAVFNGITSEHAVNGYKPTVKFTVVNGGRTLKFFVFQTLGCFGHGQFPVGVDPFIESPWRLPAIPVAKTGTYSAKVKGTSTNAEAGTLFATVTGSFTSTSKATGKITFTQDDGLSDCGPRTVKFTASSSTS
jgi:hypothetical protein